MKGIDVEDILTFHRKIIEQTGGSDGIRDISLIESALNRAFTTFDSNDLYKDIEDKISVITYGLVKNHGFVDGNKRIGVSVMLLLLRLNGIKVKYSQNELVNLGLGIADGSMDETDIKQWIKRHKV